MYSRPLLVPASQTTSKAYQKRHEFAIIKNDFPVSYSRTMKLSLFFNSFPGMYITQAFLHSLVAALIVDRAVQIWKISNPIMRQRFSFLVIVFPVLSFPIYQAITPERGSITFRAGALFDSNRWLSLEIWDRVPVSLIFIALLSITSLVFLVQEMIPILKHTFESKEQIAHDEDHSYDSMISEALEALPVEMPRISVINDDDLMLFSTTGRTPTIFLSSGLVASLNAEQLQASVAHEITHIKRNKRPLLIVIYLMRVCMFFNPVVLVEFRRVVHEEEKICDDGAVAITRKPGALSEALKKFNHETTELSLDQVKSLSTLSNSLEDYSHGVHLDGRIKRLEEGAPQQGSSDWLRFAATAAVIAVMNYFVV